MVITEENGHKLAKTKRDDRLKDKYPFKFAQCVHSPVNATIIDYIKNAMKKF